MCGAALLISHLKVSLFVVYQISQFMFIDTICDATNLGQGRRIKLLWALGVGVGECYFSRKDTNMYRPTKHAYWE